MEGEDESPVMSLWILIRARETLPDGRDCDCNSELLTRRETHASCIHMQALLSQIPGTFEVLGVRTGVN